MSEPALFQPYLRRLFDGRNFILKDGTTIVGRSEDCDLVLDEPGLSRKHARITVKDGQIILFDLGSLNGTLVNSSEALNKLPLQQGDIIIFDEIEYELLIRESATNIEVSNAQKETVVANRRERDHENLIQSEVRLVDEAFLAREAPVHRNTEESVIASISQPTFIIRGVGAAGVKIPLDTRRSEWTIGSSLEHDVSIDHPTVAKRHAILNNVSGQWQLHNCVSAKGLQINGQTIDQTVITSGDVIRIGDVECLFVCPREFNDTQPIGDRSDVSTQHAAREPTFDASDMTPIGWRKEFDERPKRRFRPLLWIAALLLLIFFVVSVFYWPILE